MSNKIQQYFLRAAESGKSSLKRITNQNVKLAVTGFSGAGKSAFITSLIHQLLYANQYHNLPFLKLSEQERLVAAHSYSLPDLTVPEFRYKENIDSLIAGQWPESTHSISGTRLSILYKPESFLANKLSEKYKLDLDIYDYPGEWLIDLIMLEQDYIQWSKRVSLSLHLGVEENTYNGWSEKLRTFKYTDSYQSEIKEYANIYRDLLCEKSAQGVLCMPGRFILPGELDGAPVLDFFPLSTELAESADFVNSEAFKLLSDRFEYYKLHVVEPFYQNFFSQIDRQLVLVDCLGLLNKVPSIPYSILLEATHSPLS